LQTPAERGIEMSRTSGYRAACSRKIGRSQQTFTCWSVGVRVGSCRTARDTDDWGSEAQS